MRNKNENPLKQIDRQLAEAKKKLFAARFLIAKIPLKREVVRLQQLRSDTRVNQILASFERNK